MENGEEILLSLISCIPCQACFKITLPKKQPTYCDLKVDGFVTNLPVDHGSFQEGSKEKELLHLPGAVLQDKSRGLGLRSEGHLGGQVPLGRLHLAPLSTLTVFFKVTCHCSGFQGDHKSFLSPSLSHLSAHCRASLIKDF